MRAERSVAGGLAGLTSAAVTFGVEEEFLLVDAVDGRPRPVAEAVLAEVNGGVAAGRELTGGTEFKHEFLTSQVESVTGICTDLAALGHQLLAARRVLAAGAARSGALLLACGLPPRRGELVPVVDEPRYRAVAEHYERAVRDYPANGCHIHVGVPDRATAVAVVNYLRPWLPTLLALSANSPYYGDRDTSFASWRITQMRAFPGSGVPPHRESPAEWEAEVARLVECGALADDRLTFWLARPSPRYPTVEFRVADAAATTAEAVLQAALSRALVRTALAALERGVVARRVSDLVAEAALWNASRYGLRGYAVDPWRETRVPAAEMVSALLAEVRPALEEMGDLDFVSRRVAWLTGRGSGAERQRNAERRGGLAGVVRQLADEALSVPDDLLPGAEAGGDPAGSAQTAGA